MPSCFRKQFVRSTHVRCVGCDSCGSAKNVRLFYFHCYKQSAGGEIITDPVLKPSFLCLNSTNCMEMYLEFDGFLTTAWSAWSRTSDIIKRIGIGPKILSRLSIKCSLFSIAAFLGATKVCSFFREIAGKLKRTSKSETQEQQLDFTMRVNTYKFRAKSCRKFVCQHINILSKLTVARLLRL